MTASDGLISRLESAEVGSADLDAVRLRPLCVRLGLASAQERTSHGLPQQGCRKTMTAGFVLTRTSSARRPYEGKRDTKPLSGGRRKISQKH